MLKIKDEVDLKELEKFGFNREWNYKTKLYDGILYCKSFKIHKNRTIQPLNGSNYDRFDKIYDLIQAGLVEKVGD